MGQRIGLQSQGAECLRGMIAQYFMSNRIIRSGTYRKNIARGSGHLDHSTKPGARRVFTQCPSRCRVRSYNLMLSSNISIELVSSISGLNSVPANLAAKLMASELSAILRRISSGGGASNK